MFVENNIGAKITSKAEELGLLIPLEGVKQGFKQWVLPAKTTHLVSAIKKLVIDEVAVRNGFEEWLFPRLVPEEVLGKTGWLTFHRPEIFFVNPKREFHYNGLHKSQQELFRLVNIFPPTPIPYVLDPVQCVCFYYSLYNKKLAFNKLPIKVFEHQGGWTWRNEVEVDGFRKAVEFMRTEIVWLGLYENVEEIRLKLIRDLVATLVNKLQLGAYLAKGETCFVEPSKQDSYNEKDFLSLENLAGHPGIDVIIKMSDKTYSEISSVGRYSELTEGFKISIQDNDEPLWSACMGVGINRLLFCLWDKFGFDETKWPNDVKIALGI